MAVKFATTINCMDGRTQEPVAEWMKTHLKAVYIDTITEPGPDKMLAEGIGLESIKKRVEISVNGHGSREITIVGHHDCAGNPVSKDVHIEQIRKSAELVLSWKLPVRIIGLWVDENFAVEVVCDTDG